MFNLKKFIVVGLMAVLLGAAPSAWAATVTGGPLSVDIKISNLESYDLSSFELEIEYNNSELNFSGYTLTEQLGSIEDGDAVDTSYTGDVTFEPGFVILSVTSSLGDDVLQDQDDNFVLATLYFWGTDTADLESSVSVNGFSMSIANYESGSIGFSIDLDTNSNDAVPVPTTILLLGTGLVGLTGLSRRRK